MQNVSICSQENSSEQVPINIVLRKGMNSHISSKAKPVGMPCVWSMYKRLDLSDNAIAVIMRSWRHSTKKQYSTYISRWEKVCLKSHISPMNPCVCHVVILLEDLISQALSYGVINTTRSTLSTCIKLAACDLSVGNHPTISRYLREIFK